MYEPTIFPPAPQPSRAVLAPERAVFAHASDPSVTTWLTIRERSRIDAVRDGRGETVHRDTLRAVRGDFAEGRADAALVSAALVQPAEVGGLAALVRSFPSSPVVAVVSDVDQSQALASALLLGRAGVRALVDCRTADGLRELRDALSRERTPDSFMRHAVAAVLADVTGESGEHIEGYARFFGAVFTPGASSTKMLAVQLNVRASTLASRFYRAGLPSPKRFIAHAQLVWAAHLAEAPGTNYGAITYRIGASSPQSFGRTIRAFTGMTATEFRRSFDGSTMLARFRESLVIPYRHAFRGFDPLGSDPRTTAPRQRRALVSCRSGAAGGAA